MSDTNELLGETAKLLGKLRDKLLELDVPPTASPQTTGERIAEGMFRKLGKHDVGIYPGVGPAYNLFVPDAPLDVSSILRTTVAAAIDKAVADECKECLAIADRVALFNDEVPPPVREAAYRIARGIRERLPDRL